MTEINKSSVLLDGIDAVRDSYSNCYVDSANAILNYLRCPYPALCFGLNYGFFQLYPLLDQAPLLTVPRLASLRDSLPLLGIERIDYADIDPEQSWQQIRHLVEQGNPVLCFVDAYWVPYMHTYKKEVDLHNIVICGFDDRDGTAFVVDSIASYRGNLPINDLKQALLLSAEAAGRMSRSSGIYWEVFQITDPYLVTTVTSTSIADQIHATLTYWDETNSLSQSMTAHAGELAGGGYRSIRYGWQAIHNYAVQLSELARTVAPGTDVHRPPFTDCRALAYQAMWFARALEILQTLDPSFNAGKDMTVIAQRWMVIHNVLVKQVARPMPHIPEKIHGLVIELVAMHQTIIREWHERYG